MAICNKYNRYILYVIIFRIVNDILYGLNHNETFETIRFASEDFSNHVIIFRLTGHIFCFSIGFCLSKYEEYASRSESLSNKSNQDIKEKRGFIKLIYIDYQNRNKTCKFFLLYLLVIFIWIVTNFLMDSYKIVLQDLDFWMFELLIICYFNSLWFKVQIYKHQKIAVIFSIISSLFKILSIYFSFSINDDDEKEQNKDYYKFNGQKPIYYRHNYPVIKIIVGCIFYLVIIFLRSISNLELKRYMDLKYISPNKILITYGLLGTIIYLAICIPSSFFPCPVELSNNNLNYTRPSEINISMYLCKVNNTEIYYENFFSFFSDFKDKKGNKNGNENNSLNILNIIVYLVGTLIFVFKEYYTLLIINFLSPIHVIFSLPIVFFFQKIIMICYTKVKTEEFFAVGNDIKLMKLLFDALGDIFSFFGFLIYLEVIKLCCYQLNYNCKTNIMRRSFGEVNRTINNDSFDNDEIIVINDDLEENEINE